MVSRTPIHCDCGTDVSVAMAVDPGRCPDCETASATTITEPPTDHDAPRTHDSTRTYRGP
ncbi:hypothetical protein CYV19_05485 [Natronobacterium gregoryi SP2]|uniref:Uncharacterized protein n=1 Tax=Natronobacterium gregoryi (strain ATCC 43098 / DSM 3393 / CCM 3738 / CIP 104747 / IAM 13177 / JCM 8860 / NBRC 102187 / NCIMB 2189 / SP2) TaxID=797304 RepID=A0A2J4JH76_NATGS|nr:hypothetical protein CYV19_05485 [Natronobacterium gregoryi SP2]